MEEGGTDPIGGACLCYEYLHHLSACILLVEYRKVNEQNCKQSKITLEKLEEYPSILYM